MSCWGERRAVTGVAEQVFWNWRVTVRSTSDRAPADVRQQTFRRRQDAEDYLYATVRGTAAHHFGRYHRRRRRNHK